MSLTDWRRLRSLHVAHMRGTRHFIRRYRPASGDALLKQAQREAAAARARFAAVRREALERGE